MALSLFEDHIKFQTNLYLIEVQGWRLDLVHTHYINGSLEMISISTCMRGLLTLDP